ncbi:MAG: hypothetical protein M3Y87_11980 [Myxococcota bacterium]|nr:hypothetical protein [Myxococcota bacterium]
MERGYELDESVASELVERRTITAIQRLRPRQGDAFDRAFVDPEHLEMAREIRSALGR